jgi:hypothetical protein
LDVHPGDRRWFGVIVIDHPDAPEDELVVGDARTLILSRRDWEFLFRHLKSTYAVARYIEVAVDLDPIPFGTEPIRYHQVAASGAAWEEDDADHPEDVEIRRHFSDGPGRRTSIFPQAPVGESIEGDAEVLHSFFRTLQEDLAIANEDDDVQLRHEMLSRLDSLPASAKELFSRTVLDRLEEAHQSRRQETGTWGRLRISDHYPQLVYMVVSKSVERAVPVMSAYQTYEHYKFARVDSFPESAATIGLLIRPRRSGLRPWEATLSFVRGDPKLSNEDLAALVEMFGPYWDDGERTGLPSQDGLSAETMS